MSDDATILADAAAIEDLNERAAVKERNAGIYEATAIQLRRDAQSLRDRAKAIAATHGWQQ